MSTFDLFQWIEDQDPDTMPFRPGVKHTQGFGLRDYPETVRAGASPAHIGNDRGALPVDIYMPFDGSVFWKSVGSVAGTLLQLIPRGNVPVEIQIFHTRRRGKTDNGRGRTDDTFHPYQGVLKRGERLEEIYTADHGMSAGSHTHTEFLVPYSEELVQYLRTIATPIYTDGKLNKKYFRDHAKKFGFTPADSVLYERKFKKQVRTWTIEEVWDTFAVRNSVPEYRTPHWGKGKTIHLCTRTFLQI